jgi:hypothetical protein
MNEMLKKGFKVLFIWDLGNMLKEPMHIKAHLVFVDTQSPNKKPKELEFCQRSRRKENIKSIFRKK